MSRPRVTVKCVAQRYAGPDERIIEFTDPKLNKGGLIRFWRADDGTLRLDIYRCDPGVVVQPPIPTDEKGR